MFNSTNFAISSRNGLLLENCSSTFNDCVVSTTRFENHFNLQQCESRSNTTMNCYSEDGPDQGEFINLEKLGPAGCQILFSSVTVDVNGSSSSSMPSPLDFQSLELGWWVRGECGCDQNAVCRNVSSQNRTLGYRCYCNEGFAGDGFSAGDGCRKENPNGTSSYS
ncbi:hypothetical protein L1987_18047 [Smallanthus sonchifolius]|uniref:Uncharacterized protein n=1 Tax=Smallanthus sonchifolius TaxID=185202 RepID=A0ACB9J245_9ASTR|nr:hypothetical protein L1987_18047 [Smallanthus sonchifolius]